MNRQISKYLFYTPATLLKGEFVWYYLPKYRLFQYLSSDEIICYQRRALTKLISYACKNTCFYNGRFNLPSLTSTNEEFFTGFRSVPELTKQDIIENRDQLISSISKFTSTKVTGGSTGEPVKILKNPQALARERAATWRAYEWAGVSSGDKQARFWGVPHANKDKLKARLIDFIANRKRISAFELNEGSLRRYYNILVRYRPIYLYGYVSVIQSLCDFIDSNNLPRLESLRAVITTSEVLTEHGRNKIQNTLGVKVFNEYGCGEVGSIAHECEHGSMHIMSDNLLVEVDSDGDSGELIVTDLHNYAMPLIRYRLGDYATLSQNSCPCGRTLPVIESIHGRAYDMIKTSTGSSIHPEAIMYIFENIQARSNVFKHFQAIQEDIDKFLIKIVPTESWSSETEALIIKKLREHISASISVTFSVTDKIDREKSGKMRVVKSLLSSS